MSGLQVWVMVIMGLSITLGWSMKLASLEIKDFINKRRKLTILGQDKTF